jgi:PleD family two-component response regulator
MSAPHQIACRQQSPILSRYDTPEDSNMAAPGSRPNETILVVDDDRDVLSTAADMLMAAGYAVESTVDPRAAIRLAAHILTRSICS